ncbi:hypothetical protein EMCRGX_G017111 [Ephydatia muelleri]
MALLVECTSGPNMIWSAGQRQSILLSRLFNNSTHQGLQQQEAVAIATPRQLSPEPQRPKDVDKELLVSEREVSLSHFQLLYSAPEAILCTDTLWRQLLLSQKLLWQYLLIDLIDHTVVDLMAFVPSGALVPATTATVTIRMRDDIIEMLDMVECQGLPTSQTSDMG